MQLWFVSEHIAKCGITKPHANNNRVERLNGTLREHVKVQRGWKNPKSAIPDGQRIYYNFIKPLQALDGKTPAEKSNINVKDGNKLIGFVLLRRDWFSIFYYIFDFFGNFSFPDTCSSSLNFDNYFIIFILVITISFIEIIVIWW